VLVLSQYVEENYAADLLSGELGGVGYRMTEVAQFVETVERVGEGGTVIDPEVVSQLLARSRRRQPPSELSPRDREVLALMAEGRSNAGIAEVLVVTPRAVEKHVGAVGAGRNRPAPRHDRAQAAASSTTPPSTASTSGVAGFDSMNTAATTAPAAASAAST
jgi:DNA-binding CsgD family transcriptional regulator